MQERDSRLVRLHGLSWVLRRDSEKFLIRHFLRHPIRYLSSYLRSLSSSHPFQQDGDFFFYGVSSVEDVISLLAQPKTILAVGLSYCQKPLSCPAARFSEQCIADSGACEGCPIGRMKKFENEKTAVFVISTVNSVGNTLFRLLDTFPDHNIVFCITACDMSLRMFSDLANMIGLKGVGVRLEGQVCPTLKAFMAAEDGHKRGVTNLTSQTEKKVFDLLTLWQQYCDKAEDEEKEHGRSLLDMREQRAECVLRNRGN